MNGFFSAVGPTTVEETRHARALDRTTVCRYTPEPDARCAAQTAVCGGGRGDGWPCAAPLAPGARSGGGRGRPPRGGTPAHGSCHGGRAATAGRGHPAARAAH